MIVATIGSDMFLMDDLRDANLLLEILNRAKPAAEGYVNKSYDRKLYLKESDGHEVKVEIRSGEPLSFEQYNELREKAGVTA